MTDISDLVGGPSRSGRPTGGQRARVVRPPAELAGPLSVTLLAYTNEYEYEVPATNWVSRGTDLPAKGDVGVTVFDDHGDAWFIVGGGTTFPAGGGGGGPETDPVASAALTAHAADTTAVHGIADTSLLVVTSDTRLTNARAPTAHHATHEPGGSDPMAVDAAAATGSLRSLGTGAAQAAAGNDSRLSNARTPTAHATSHQPGGSDAMAVDAAAATGSLRTLGPGAAQAAPGNDARLSDARTPVAGSVVNASVNAAAAIARSKLDFGSGLVNADIAAAAGIAKSKLAALTIVNADVDAAAAIAEAKLALATDAAAGTGSRRTLGPGALQAAPGNDARLSDARTPTAHQSSHQSGNADALTGNLDAVGRSNVKKAGTIIGTRRGINFIEGTNVTITVADDAANEEVDVTIAAVSGASASALAAAWPLDVRGGGVIGAALAAATYVLWAGHAALGSSAVGALAAANTVAGSFHIDPADHAVSGLTPKLQIEALCDVGATAPGRTITVALYPVTTLTNTGVAVVGTAVGTVTFTTPALNTHTRTLGAEFTLPTAGRFILGATVVGGATAAGSSTQIGVHMRMRWV